MGQSLDLQLPAIMLSTPVFGVFFLFGYLCQSGHSLPNVTKHERNVRQFQDPDSETFSGGGREEVTPGKALNPTLIQEAALARKIRLGEANELSPDDLVVTLQEERRKILTEIYGFDPLEATFGDYDLGIAFPTVTEGVAEVDEVKDADDDTVTVERKLLRKLILAQRRRRLRNRAKLYGIRNPYIAKSLL